MNKKLIEKIEKKKEKKGGGLFKVALYIRNSTTEEKQNPNVQINPLVK